MGQEQNNSGDTLGHLIRNFEEGTETVFDVKESVDGGKLSVERRRLRPEPPELPPLARAGVANHCFHTIDSVVAYVSEFKSEHTVIIADALTNEAAITLDELVNEDNQTTLVYRPAFHPVFAMWRKFFGVPQPVLDFAMFAMENRRQIVIPDGRELALLLTQLKMAKSIVVAHGVGPKQINGVMTTVEIRGQKTDTEVPLPDMLTIRTPIFVTDDALDVEFDLLVYEQGGAIMVKGSNPDIAVLVAERFLSGVDELRGSLEGVVVTYGSAKYRPVNELKG